MLKRLILATSILVAGAAMLLVPSTSEASTIPYNCTKCGNHNTSFDISYSLVNAATNEYELTVTAVYQPDGAGTMDYVYINAIAMWIKDVTFDGLPTVQSGPDAGPWNIVTGGLAANGCVGAGEDFFCVNSVGWSGAGHTGPGDTDTWVFLLDLAAPLGATQTIHFKGHFVDANGRKVGELISDDFFANNENPGCDGGPCVPTAVPEPASLLLMGAGLTLVAARLRRKARS